MNIFFLRMALAIFVFSCGTAYAGRLVRAVSLCRPMIRDMNVKAFGELLPHQKGKGTKRMSRAQYLAPFQAMMAEEMNLNLAICNLLESIGEIPKEELLGLKHDGLEFNPIGDGIFRVKSFILRSPQYGRIRFNLKNSSKYRARVMDKGELYYLDLVGPFANYPLEPY